MKKVIAVIVLFVIALGFLTTCFAESSKNTHLLWDIPFGTSVDEFVRLAKEATGFEFVKSDGGYPRVGFFSDPMTPSQIAGNDVSAVVPNFSSKEELFGITIYWFFDDNDFTGRNAAIFSNIAYQLEQKFGKADVAMLVLTPEVGQKVYVKIERDENSLDVGDIIRAQSDGILEILATVYINNINLQYYWLKNGDLKNQLLTTTFSETGSGAHYSSIEAIRYDDMFNSLNREAGF